MSKKASSQRRHPYRRELLIEGDRHFARPTAMPLKLPLERL
jgi:hypothetical protein